MKRTNTGVKGQLFYTTLISPIGPIYIAFTKRGVSRIVLGKDSERSFVKNLEKGYNKVVKRNDRGLASLKKELKTYFALSKRIKKVQPTFSFSSPLDLLDGTPFEKKVWLGIKEIPYGKVISYKDLAIRIGRPEGARAIGRACKKNPLPILIPCHRVIGKDRSLKGYSSGIEIKRRLLEIEGGLESKGIHHGMEDIIPLKAG